MLVKLELFKDLKTSVSMLALFTFTTKETLLDLLEFKNPEINNMTFSPVEIKYIWKHRGNKNYLLKAIKTKEEIVESLIFDDIKNSFEVSGKILSSPKEGEAYHWPRLIHVSLAPLLDILSINETVSIYISTVFEKGLRDTIQEEEFTKRLDCLSRKKSYAEGILWALDYLHGKSLCLMNLNEGNIYVSSRNDKAVITDFSSLTLVDRAIKSRVAVPTLYRAPELAASSSERFYPKAAEMWASGVLMLQIFSDQVESSFDGDPDKYVLQLAQSLCGKLDESSKQGSVEECNAVDEFKIFLDLFLKVDPCSRTTASNAALSCFLRRRKETDQESGNLCMMGGLQEPELDEECENENQLSETDVNLVIKPVESVIDIPIKGNAKSFVTLEYVSDQERLNNEKFKDSLRNYISNTDAPLEKGIILDETDIKKCKNKSDCLEGMPIENSNAKGISDEKVSYLSMALNKGQYDNLSEPIKNTEKDEIHTSKNSSNILPHNQDKPTSNVLQPLDRCISDLSINKPNFPTENEEMYSNKGSMSSWETDTGSDSSEDEAYSTDSLEVSGPVLLSKSNESLSVKEKPTKLSENNLLHQMEDHKRSFSESLGGSTDNRNVKLASVANDLLEDDRKSLRIQLHSEADLLGTVFSRSLNISSLPSFEQNTLSKNGTGHQEDDLYNNKLLYRNGETCDLSGKNEDYKRKRIFEDEHSSPPLIRIRQRHSPISHNQINTPTSETNGYSSAPEIVMNKAQNEYYEPEESPDTGGVNNLGIDCIVGDFASSDYISVETNGNSRAPDVLMKRNEFHDGDVGNLGFDCVVEDFTSSGDTYVKEPVEEKPNKRLPSNLVAISSSENKLPEQDKSEKSAKKSWWFVNRYGELELSVIDFFEQPEKKKKKREKSKFKKSWFHHFCPGCQARGDETEMLCSFYSA